MKVTSERAVEKSQLNPFDTLPEEIVEKILSFLQIQNWPQTAKVCTRWERCTLHLVKKIKPLYQSGISPQDNLNFCKWLIEVKEFDCAIKFCESLPPHEQLYSKWPVILIQHLLKAQEYDKAIEVAQKTRATNWWEDVPAMSSYEPVDIWRQHFAKSLIEGLLQGKKYREARTAAEYIPVNKFPSQLQNKLIKSLRVAGEHKEVEAVQKYLGMRT